MKPLLICAVIAGSLAFGQAQTGWRPSVLRKVGIDQKLGAQIPADLPFVDEAGRPVTLRQYLDKPVILALVYYQCPSLCNMVLNGVLRSVKNIPMDAGVQYNIVAVSFDSRETWEMAAAKKATYIKGYNRPGAERGWHFLTGSDASIRVLTDAVGFHYAYDTVSNQFAHGSAIILLTPDGKVTRYFYGIDYPARDLRLSLVEASDRRIGSPVDAVMLYCYHYDPANGKYGMVIMNVLRLAGFATVAMLAGFMIFMFRRDIRAV
jgi:protein SCO1/2